MGCVHEEIKHCNFVHLVSVDLLFCIAIRVDNMIECSTYYSDDGGEFKVLNWNEKFCVRDPDGTIYIVGSEEEADNFAENLALGKDVETGMGFNTRYGKITQGII